MKYARRRVEAIVIFRRPQEILIVAGLRRERQRRRDGIVGIEFERIVLGLVDAD